MLMDLDRTRDQIVQSLLLERFGDWRVLALERVATPAQKQKKEKRQ